MFHGYKNAGMINFIKFHNELNRDECLEIQDKKKKITDEELIEIIHRRYKINAKNISHKPKEKRKTILWNLLKIQGISTRQLARVTGVSVNIIWKL